jgi:transcriptional regulator with XRE-family HTH domain
MPEVGTWGEYIKKYSRGESQGVIAENMGVDTSTVGRWLKGSEGQPRAEKAINFARHYGRSPVEALIHAGYIEAEEVGQAIEIAGSMRDVSDKALLDELAGRLADFRRHLMGGNDTQEWPPPGWRHENTGVSQVENGDYGG